MNTIKVIFKGEGENYFLEIFKRTIFTTTRLLSLMRIENRQIWEKEKFIDENSLIRALAICEHYREVGSAASLLQTQKGGLSDFPVICRGRQKLRWAVTA